MLVNLFRTTKFVLTFGIVCLSKVQLWLVLKFNESVCSSIIFTTKTDRRNENKVTGK